MAAILANEPVVPKNLPAGKPRVTSLIVDGMTCGNCARHVSEALQSVPGVQSAQVSLDSKSANVRWAAEASDDPALLVNAVESEGFTARVVEDEEAHTGEGALGAWKVNVLLGVPVTLVLLAGEWWLKLDSQPWFAWFSLFAAGAVQIFAGAKFYRGAWAQLKAGSSNMDTLVALGSTTAFGFSTWALLTHYPGHLYFMEASAIITLISVGHWMESRVSARASSALRQLLNLAPAVAQKRNADGTEVQVSVSALVNGDHVVLRPGNQVPTDGKVVEGVSTIDESMLTGESIPVDKNSGAQIYGGTLNINGQLVMEVTATGEETALANIILAVQRAQNSRASIQRIGDRVSNVFVPIVVGVAVLAALWWGLAPDSARQVHNALAPLLWHALVPTGTLAAALITAAAVLIIACPCAMGLATPAAIMAGSNAAAQRGILIRDGVALEKAGQITCVLFDKTGTLTAGKPVVAASWTSRPSDAAAINLASSLARRSTHPISRAIAQSSGAEVSLRNFKENSGAGLEAQTSDEPATLLRLGSLPWLQACSVETTAANQFIEAWSHKGATLVGLTSGTQLLAVFAVTDSLKPGAPEVIRELQRQGFATYLVSGDRKATALAVAQQAGIDATRVFAEVRPEQKAEIVKKLQAQGEQVAFVGDGINDAPAIEQANLGIGVSRASDIAREAADIILLKSDLQAVPESLGLARATLRTIKQNLFWAFFYNAIGIPLAALGFMSPILCAAAMALSDLVVIGNALRLMNWRLRP